jgi:hypothetical protein
MSLKTKTTLSGMEQRKTPSHHKNGQPGVTRSLELLVEEFQSFISFGAAGLSSRGK